MDSVWTRGGMAVTPQGMHFMIAEDVPAASSTVELFVRCVA